MYAKDPFEANYLFLINKQESKGLLKHLNDSKAFIEYSNDIHDIYKNIKKLKTLIVFDDMIADVLSNNKLFQ